MVSSYTMATHFEGDGETCIDKEKIANGFNKFFTGAVTRLLEVGQVVKPINNPFKLFWEYNFASWKWYNHDEYM